MSRFFPHTPYAEDQPYSRTILWTHVLTRGATAGSLVSLGIFSARTLATRTGVLRVIAYPTAAAAAGASLIRTAGTSTAVALALTALATVGRMRGREDIEWRDRSWRLMENAGQLETDDFTYGASAAALVGAAASAPVRASMVAAGWRGPVAVAGLGSVVGMFGYLGWRYGVRGGERKEKQV